jgi:tetratricopeptide (TPR) repeat protein
MSSANSSNSQLTIPQALQLASQHQLAGKLQEAEQLLRKVLQLQPDNVYALHLLGCIAHQAQQLDIAIQLIERAIVLEPKNALFQRNVAEMYRQQGDTQTAISKGKLAIALDPTSATALSNVGIAYYDLEDYPQAIDFQQQAIAIDPQLVTALNNLGSIYRAQKDTERAIEYYRQAIAADPQYAEALNNLGAVLTEQSLPEQGLEVLLTAVKLNPRYAEAQRNLGSCYMALEKTTEARAAFQLALQLKPNFTEALLGLASLEQEATNYAKAQQLIQHTISLDSHNANSFIQLAGLLNVMGFAERAIENYQQALALEPDNIAAHVGHSNVLTEQGLIDEAEQLLQQALQIDPQSLPARISLVQLKKVRADDKNVLSLIEEAKQLDPQFKTKAIGLHFALGKSHDDIGDYQQGFHHFLTACRLKREKISYSQTDNTLATLNIITTFTPELIDRFSGGGDPSTKPIFILGMPRSGTTLTEQIIASHPACHGAGELADLNLLANPGRLENNASSLYPQTLSSMTAAELKALGQQYVAGLSARQPTAEFITDKMPSNYFYLGLIHLMLPNAKIIHVKRNPVDTCISNFSKLFKQGQHFSYELGELGNYYRDYDNLMQHWRKLLPANAFYEIQYEQLVDNIEQQARALIDYCGLPWHPDCLNFHNHQRTVRTASVTQVRQPIYTSSVERWRHYEEYLQPLLTALGDLAPQ